MEVLYKNNRTESLIIEKTFNRSTFQMRRNKNEIESLYPNNR